MEKSYFDMSYEERKAYIESLPLCEEGFKATPIHMSDEEYNTFKEKHGCYTLEEIINEINDKYGV